MAVGSQLKKKFLKPKVNSPTQHAYYPKRCVDTALTTHVKY